MKQIVSCNNVSIFSAIFKHKNGKCILLLLLFQVGSFLGNLSLGIWSVTGIAIDPDSIADVGGACVVLHNMAMSGNVPLVEKGEIDEGGYLDIRIGIENNLSAEAATVHAYFTATHFK